MRPDEAKEVPAHIMGNRQFIQDLRYCKRYSRLVTMFNDIYGPDYILLPRQMETLHGKFKFQNWQHLKVLFEKLWGDNEVTEVVTGIARQLNISEGDAVAELARQLEEL